MPAQSRVGYLPVINAPSTDPATCVQVLNNTVNIAKQLNQQDIVLVADQAIYAKLQDIVWKDGVQGDQALYSNVVPRMGTFHIICVLLAVIGKRFADSGLRELLVDGKVVSSGSVNAVLDGKHYNRAVRAHLTLAEALEQFRWRQFEEMLAVTDCDIGLDDLEPSVRNLRDDLSRESIDKLTGLEQFQAVHDAYAAFCSSDHGPMFQFWSSYLEMVMLLRCLIRATRQGLWQLHLQCIHQLLPWLFAYDRTNYCRYLPAYWCEMMMLPQTHPDAAMQMEKGEFCVQRSTSNAFAQVPVDQALEQTINRDTKVSGGT